MAIDLNKWTKGTDIYVSNSPPLHPVVFVNTYSNTGQPEGIWSTINVSEHVADDCKAIHLTGIIIITHGTQAETADIHLSFRKPGELYDNYAHQCIEASIGNGQRSTMSTWVPLNDNKEFEFKYACPNGVGQWPSLSAYGINLSIDAFLA